MTTTKEEIWYLLKFYYNKDKNVTQATREICKVYEEDAESVGLAQYWFKRFKSRNFDMKAASCSGRPTIENIDDIFTEIKLDRHICRMFQN